MKDEEIIIIKNLYKTYSKKTPFEYEAIVNLNLEIKSGEFLSIIGDTGSGKSTLITHLNGLTKPTKGSLQIFDYEITSSKKKIKSIKDLRRRIGMVFQFPEYQLFEDTVLKDVMFGPRNFGQDKEKAKELAIKYLKLMNVPENLYNKSPFDLSGGQKRKVALAGILAIETEILVFDEPTAGLDPESEIEVLQLCKKLHNQGKTIIFVTHNMENVLKYSTSVAVIKDKKIVIKDTPSKIFTNKKLMEETNISLPNTYRFFNKYIKNKKIRTPQLYETKDLVKALSSRKK